MKNNSETPEHNPDFVHIPKQVHRNALIQMLGSAALMLRMELLVGTNLYGNKGCGLVEASIESMGYSWLSLPENLTDRLMSHVETVAMTDVTNLTELNLPKIGKKILKHWKIEFKSMNLKRDFYE